MRGRADVMLKRSAEETDGWIAGGQSPSEALREAWQKVRGYAQAAGKNPDALEAAKLMYISVGEDRACCREQLRAFMHAYYGSQFD
jgi:alkanesulfonate monooxygenase SsuD/methylene tetrahydromethanopterin reductase-like flavin-dependent oxidoreductase (luciferase family)